MERRKFLSYLAVGGTSLIVPNVMYASQVTTPGEEKLPKEKAQALDILNDKSNFNYSNNITTKKGAEELRRSNMEYIVNSSIDLLDDSRKRYSVETQNLKINMALEQFKKIISKDPTYIIPLTTSILKHYGKDTDEVVSAATVNEGGLEKGLWYVQKGEIGDEITGKVSIPYSGEDRMIIYGDGKRWGLTGEFVSLIKYNELEGNTNLDMSIFVKTKGWGVFSSFGRGLAAANVKENATKLLKNSEDLVDILKNHGEKITEQEYGVNEVRYLKGLVQNKEPINE